MLPINFSNQQQFIQRILNQLSKNTRILTPADDPTGAANTIMLDASISRKDVFLTNNDLATARLTESTTAASNFLDTLTEGRALLLNAMSETNSPADMAALGQSMQALASQALSVLNSAGSDTYLFSGYQDRKPFDDTGAYVSDQGRRQVQIADDLTVDTTVPGFDFANALQDFMELAKSVSSGVIPVDAIQTLDSGIERTQAIVTRLGATSNMVQSVKAVMTSETAQEIKMKAEINSLDIPAAISELLSRRTTYQASLAAYARTKELSLFDYL